MKKVNQSKFKLSNKTKNMFKLIGTIAILVLIYIAAPHCTQVTRDIIKFLYELDTEYITRFWTILLSLTTVATIYLFNNKNEE